LQDAYGKSKESEYLKELLNDLQNNKLNLDSIKSSSEVSKPNRVQFHTHLPYEPTKEGQKIADSCYQLALKNREFNKQIPMIKGGLIAIAEKSKSKPEAVLALLGLEFMKEKKDFPDIASGGGLLILRALKNESGKGGKSGKLTSEVYFNAFKDVIDQFRDIKYYTNLSFIAGSQSIYIEEISQKSSDKGLSGIDLNSRYESTPKAQYIANKGYDDVGCLISYDKGPEKIKNCLESMKNNSTSQTELALVNIGLEFFENEKDNPQILTEGGLRLLMHLKDGAKGKTVKEFFSETLKDASEASKSSYLAGVMFKEGLMPEPKSNPLSRFLGW
jgi:hypothetical protein